MAAHKPISSTLKTLICLLLLALTISCATSARILDEVPTAPSVASVVSDPVEDVVIPVTAPTVIQPNVVPGVTPVSKPMTGIAPVATPAVAQPIATPVSNPATVVAPVATPSVTQPSATPAAATTGTVATADPHHTLSFFMHDILGGSNPSAKAVTGIVTNPAVNGQLPFSRPNGAVLPVNNGIPLNNGNNGIINNNNLPFLTGLGGSTNTLVQNNGNNFMNGGFGLPSVNGAQLPGGTTVQKLMFGTMTVIDDELTEGHELGSGLVGKAQGFYVVSSEDGSSQTMAFTAMFESGSYVDSISFFGVHLTAVSESQIGIMGGTGKYVNAKGFATVKTIPSTNQHDTDGVETLLEFTVYLA
ncbi:hypothetical protein IFM89_023573 [Coptis chinensis]|uniref:Dirigent protein n=1 Tax=Coptis chinensis TaxID=261450 RepID=A0A835LSL0_9MAGN|nr:hypothetical protein IFM89_023573 [Coptis chinensis]